LARWARFNDCRGWKKCEKVRKNAKKCEKFGKKCEKVRKSEKKCEKFGKSAKNSVVLVNFVAFWGHFASCKKVG
jgi:hypothetical protein